MKVVLLLAVPGTVGLMVLREPIVALLFQRGAFDARATAMTSAALLFFAVGLAARLDPGAGALALRVGLDVSFDVLVFAAAGTLLRLDEMRHLWELARGVGKPRPGCRGPAEGAARWGDRQRVHRRIASVPPAGRGFSGSQDWVTMKAKMTLPGRGMGRRLVEVELLREIAYFSNQPFSKQDLAPVLQRYPRLVQAVMALPEVQFRYAGTVFSNRRDPVRFLQFVLRKAAHLFLYGMYGDGQFCPRNCAGTGHAWPGKIVRRFPDARPERKRSQGLAGFWFRSSAGGSGGRPRRAQPGSHRGAGRPAGGRGFGFRGVFGCLGVVGSPWPVA